MIRITHRDEVEAPITDWLEEAYERSDELSKSGGLTSTRAPKKQATRKRKSAQSRERARPKIAPALKHAQKKQPARERGHAAKKLP